MYTLGYVTVLIFLAAPLVFSSLQFGSFNPQNILDAATQWAQFKLDHLKQFSVEEDTLRFDIFKENLNLINELQQKFLRGEINFQVGITQFADLTKHEFVDKFLTLKVPPHNKVKRQVSRSNRTRRQIPQYVDWRERGAVTPVKNQGECASCWAFSALGSIEAQNFLRTGNLISLSEQNLIDCSVDEINNGCRGGWMANAFKYLTSSDVTSEDEYSYVGSQQSCSSGNKNVRLSIKGYQNLSPDEDSLQQAVASVGPISAAIDGTNLQFYAGGVYRDDDCLPRQVNHGVLVVGYGTEGERDYWLIKNSWGPKWGEQGYFKLIRNKGNQCSIASYGMYPVL